MSEAVSERVNVNQRGKRYGEVFAAYLTDDGVRAEVFGTQMLNDCPQELWEKLDVEAIRVEMDAVFVKLNGPRYWLIDAIGAKTAVVEPVIREFGGIEMRRLAEIDLGANPASTPYTLRQVHRGAIFFFDAGKPVYELLDPDGTPYVMQAYCVGVDPSLTEEDLAGLGERLQLPPGWTFRTRILTEELVIDTSDRPATVVQDEFENTYSGL